MAEEAIMSKWENMQERVDNYLLARRSVGFILRIEGEQLQRFASFAKQHDHQGHITLDLAVLGRSIPRKATKLVVHAVWRLYDLWPNTVFFLNQRRRSHHLIFSARHTDGLHLISTPTRKSLFYWK